MYWLCMTSRQDYQSSGACHVGHVVVACFCDKLVTLHFAYLKTTISNSRIAQTYANICKHIQTQYIICKGPISQKPHVEMFTLFIILSERANRTAWPRLAFQNLFIFPSYPWTLRPFPSFFQLNSELPWPSRSRPSSLL